MTNQVSDEINPKFHPLAYITIAFDLINFIALVLIVSFYIYFLVVSYDIDNYDILLESLILAFVTLLFLFSNLIAFLIGVISWIRSKRMGLKKSQLWSIVGIIFSCLCFYSLLMLLGLDLLATFGWLLSQ